MKRYEANELAVLSGVLAVGLAISASAQDPGLLSALDQATARAEAAAGQAATEAADTQTRLMQAVQEVGADAATLIEVPEEAVMEAVADIQAWGEEAADAAAEGAEEAAAAAVEVISVDSDVVAAKATGLMEEAAAEAEAVAQDAVETVDDAIEAGAEAVQETAEAAEVMAEEAMEEVAEMAAEAEAIDVPVAEEEVIQLVTPPMPEMLEMEEAMDEGAVDDVLVEINGVPYTAAEADAEVEKRLNMFAGQVPPAQLDSIRERMRAQVVDDFVNRTLIQNELEESGIAIEDAEIEEFIAQAREGLPPGFTLEEFLEQRGLSIDEMRRDVGFQLAAKKLLDNRLGDQLVVSEEEVQAFFESEKDRMAQPESVRARHILLSVEADASDEDRDATRQEIESIREELLAGASFEDVAAEKSTCPSSSRGGDLGNFARGQMVPPFEEAAFSQEIGVVGDVVETRFGYHLIEVLERTEATEPDIEEAREQIVEVLQNQRRAQAFQDYIQDLRATSSVVFPTP
jgi:peptidyl-prolyl cis-trans isomerase C